MITDLDIKASINVIKELDGAGRTKLTFEIFQEQPELSNFINEGHYSVIKRHERNSLNYFIEITFLVLKTKYGSASIIKTQELRKEKEKLIVQYFFKQTITVHPKLEEYMKMIIHSADISEEAAKHCVAVICAFIKLYTEKANDQT